MPWHRTGKVTLKKGSKEITGLGSLWSTSVNPGDAFALVDANDNPTGAWYEVEKINSNTSMTLKQTYAGSTGSNKKYVIFNLVGNMTTPSFAQRLAKFFEQFRDLKDMPTQTPMASRIPIAGSNGKLSSGWFPEATETQPGAVELASTAEVKSGTDKTKSVTPSGVKEVIDDFSGYVLKGASANSSASGYSWVKVAEVDGVTATSGDHLVFIIAGAGNFGSHRRDSYLISAAQRGVNVFHVKIIALIKENPAPLIFYTQKLSEFSFAIWVRRPSYDAPLSLTKISRRRQLSTNLGILETVKTAPVDLVEIPVEEYLTSLEGATKGLSVTSSDNATSPVSAPLKSAGGVAVAKDLWVGKDIHQGNTQIIGNTSGALTVAANATTRLKFTLSGAAMVTGRIITNAFTFTEQAGYDVSIYGHTNRANIFKIKNNYKSNTVTINVSDVTHLNSTEFYIDFANTGGEVYSLYFNAILTCLNNISWEAIQL